MFPEPRRTMVGGQMEAQAVGIDRLITEIFECVRVGDTEDEKMGVDLPELKFDRQRVRELIQAFLDNRLVGKGG